VRARQNGGGTGGRSLRLGDGFVDEPRRVSDSAQVLPLVRQVDGAQFRMRLQEETIGGEGGPEQSGQGGLSSAGAIPVDSTRRSGRSSSLRPVPLSVTVTRSLPD